MSFVIVTLSFPLKQEKCILKVLGALGEHSITALYCAYIAGKEGRLVPLLRLRQSE